jgi:hypothetical protein
LDPAEVEFPYDNPALFCSMEDPRRLFVHPRTLRTAYHRQMTRWLDETARAMTEAGIDYHRIDSRSPPAQILGQFLRSRERRG